MQTAAFCTLYGCVGAAERRKAAFLEPQAQGRREKAHYYLPYNVQLMDMLGAAGSAREHVI